MKTKWGILLVIVILITGSLVISVKGQAGVFVIEGADEKIDLSVSSSADLLMLVNSVADRFIVEFANGLQMYNIQSIPGNLLVLINNVEARPVIEFANSNRYYQVAYPKDMLNDNTPPQLIHLSISYLGSGTATFTFDINEYSTLMLEYGTQSGVYPYSLSINNFSIQHVLSLSGLASDTIYKYRYTLVDRSGNTFVSSENVFSLPRTVYLPFIRR